MRKTASFALVHMTVAFAVGYAFTGSLWAGSALALIEPLCNTVAFHWHEKLWAHLDARREQATANSRREAAPPLNWSRAL